MSKAIKFFVQLFIAILIYLFSGAFSQMMAQKVTSQKKVKAYVVNSGNIKTDTIIWHFNEHDFDHEYIRLIVDSAMEGMEEELQKIEILLDENAKMIDDMKFDIMMVSDSIDFERIKIDIPDIDSIMETVKIKFDMDSLHMKISAEMEEMEELMKNIHHEDGMIWFGDDEQMKVKVIKGKNGRVTVECDGETIHTLDSLGGNMILYVNDSTSGDIFTTRGDANWIFAGKDNPLEGVNAAKIVVARSDNKNGKDVDFIAYTTEEGNSEHMVKLNNAKKEDIDYLKEQGVKFSGEKLETDTFILFPNPSEGRFKVKFMVKEKAKTEIRVLDENGHEIYNKKLGKALGWQEEEIQLDGQFKGTFFVQIISGEKQSTKKLIVQ